MLPLDQCDMHLGQNLPRCPRTTLEVRVVALWLPPGQLHGNSSTSPYVAVMAMLPRVLCV